MKQKIVGIICLVCLLSACGFSPLHVVEDQKTTDLTAQVEIAPIPDYNGYLLAETLRNKLNPDGVDISKKYTLVIALQNPQYVNQSIRGDNFATRTKVTMRANYKLIDKTTQADVLSGQTNATGSYNIITSPYATETAKKKTQEDVLKILADNIALHMISYFKAQEVTSESQKLSN